MVKVVSAYQHRRLCQGCGKKGVQRLILSDGAGTLNVRLCLSCFRELNKLLEQEGEMGAGMDAAPCSCAAVPVP